MTLVHASCVAIDGSGTLLRGPSGSGKSDLALRLIDDGAVLVADDYVELSREGDRVVARPPPQLAGLLEARGIGILRLPYADAPLALVVDLVPASEVERMPEPATAKLCDLDVPVIRLDPFAASACAKLRLAVRVAAGGIILAR